MSGRCVIVTGATSGIGVKAVEYLCEAGDNVILAARNDDRAKLISEKVKQKNPQALIHCMQLDLSSRESIEKFVTDFRALDKKLTVLINNGAILGGTKETKRQLTPEGMETTLGTNYFGPWLLTHLLLEDLKAAAAVSEETEARIVNVVCSGHDHTTSKKNTLKELDVDDMLLCQPGAFNGGQAYKDSKALMMMWTTELAKQLEGTKVTVNAVCPGFVPSTQLYRNCPVARRYFNKWIMGGMLRFLKTVTTVDKAAESLFDLSDDAKYKGITGKYFKEKKEAEPSEECKSEEKQKQVWTKTGGYLKLEGFEPLDIPEPPPEPVPETPKKEKKEEKKTEEEEKDKEEEKKEEKEGEKEGEKTEEKEETKEEKMEEKEPEDKPEEIADK